MEKTIGERCFEYRVAHDLSQQAMGKLCKLNWLTINKCEKGLPIRKMSAAKILLIIEKEE